MKISRFIKYILVICIGLLILSSFSSSSNSEDDITQVPDVSTNTDYDVTSILSKFDSIDAITYSVSGNKFTILTTDLPNNTSPYWDELKIKCTV